MSDPLHDASQAKLTVGHSAFTPIPSRQPESFKRIAQLEAEVAALKESVERLRKLRWGVEYKGNLIAAFFTRFRAEMFAALGREDTEPPARDTIKVVDLFCYPPEKEQPTCGGTKP